MPASEDLGSATDLLNTLTTSLSHAEASIPQSFSFHPPPEGISLLDTKNDILLAYNQHLVCLILLKLRNQGPSSTHEDTERESAAVKKLVELRTYLEKGVRPLETRLRYQIDKVLRASDDVLRSKVIKTSGRVQPTTTYLEMSDESEKSDEDEAARGVSANDTVIEELQYRPNPSALLRPKNIASGHDQEDATDGIYKPPRIMPTSMHTTTPQERKARQAETSATINEFINDELSLAPVAIPSIGSNVLAGGRRSKSEKENRADEERREYEERNYVRLPAKSKKERARLARTRKDPGYGGEDWRGLGEGAERISRLTAKKGSSARNVLEKSRKRAVEDGPRDDGTGAIGEGFRKRVKILDGREKGRSRGKK